jgi:hypothetical protein
MPPERFTGGGVVAGDAFLLAVLFHRHSAAACDDDARPACADRASPDLTRRLGGPVGRPGRCRQQGIAGRAEEGLGIVQPRRWHTGIDGRTFRELGQGWRGWPCLPAPGQAWQGCAVGRALVAQCQACGAGKQEGGECQQTEPAPAAAAPVQGPAEAEQQGGEQAEGEAAD